MAGPSKVEFPGDKKRQRMRMRGTKQASADAKKRLGRNLARLLEDPEDVMPDLIWDDKLPWGRTDPVTKTLREIGKVISNKHNRKWL